MFVRFCQHTLASAIADESLDSSKQQPVLSLGSWSAADSIYSAPVSYDGDGTLSVNVGSISNGVLTVNDDDGTFNGVITASGGESYAPAQLNFSVFTLAFIDSFSISPAELTIASGASATAEINITTSPPNAAYTLTAPDAPDWVSIDDATLVFSPASTMSAGNYQVTIQANTNADQKTTTEIVTIEKEKVSPNLRFAVNNPMTFKSIVTTVKGDGYQQVRAEVPIEYDGEPNRKITYTGRMPKASTKTADYVYNPKDYGFQIIYVDTLSYRTGSGTCTLKAAIDENDEYLSEEITATITGCYAEAYTINQTYTPK